VRSGARPDRHRRPRRRVRRAAGTAAGHLVLSGALGPFVPFGPGDVVEATISGFETLVAEFKE